MCFKKGFFPSPPVPPVFKSWEAQLCTVFLHPYFRQLWIFASPYPKIAKTTYFIEQMSLKIYLLAPPSLPGIWLYQLSPMARRQRAAIWIYRTVSNPRWKAGLCEEVLFTENVIFYLDSRCSQPMSFFFSGLFN